MTPDDIRTDGIRSYELAIKTARSKMLEPTEAKLWDAIKTLRDHGVLVSHSEGIGIESLWDVGPLKRIAYFEVLRRAQGSKVVAGKRLANKLVEKVTG